MPTPAHAPICRVSEAGLLIALLSPDDIRRHPPLSFMRGAFLHSQSHAEPSSAACELSRQKDLGKHHIAVQHNSRRLPRRHAPVNIGKWVLPAFHVSNAPPQSPPSGLPSATAKSSDWSGGFALRVLPIFVRSFPAVGSSYCGG